MEPSSRTPEGTPQRCPICGKLVRVDSSMFPTKDAPCPVCGHLLWFTPAFAASHQPPDRPFVRPKVRRTSRPQKPSDLKEVPFSNVDRVVWSIIAIASTLLVVANDGFVFSATLWVLVIVGYSQLLLPTDFRFVHRLLERDELLYFGVLCGWGLVAGPLVGVTFGVLLPFIDELGLTSFEGGVFGLVVGPLFAATVGLTLVGLIDLMMWIMTGKGLAKRMSGE